MPSRKEIKTFLRQNSLSLTLFFVFFLPSLVGQSIAGLQEHNHERQDHHQPSVGYWEYVRGSHFLEATAENWESEFAQLFTYVLLTAFLIQKGSAESKSPEEPAEPMQVKADSPWPVRRGGWVLKVYENSLTLTFFILFLISMFLHAAGGAKEYNQDQAQHGGEPVSLIGYLGTSRFWFESLQNWQSEFLAIWTVVVFSIFLRQKGSPESKKVEAPYSATGKD